MRFIFTFIGLFFSFYIFADDVTYIELSSVELPQKMYSTVNEKGMQFVSLKKNMQCSITLPKLTEKSGVLWGRIRINDGNKATISYNGNIALKNTQYFEWVKIGVYQMDLPLLINVDTTNVDIMKFAIVSNQVEPYFQKYVIDDIKPELLSNRTIKFYFNTEKLSGAEVVLYRAMTMESYIDYLKNILGVISESEIAINVAKYLISPYKEIKRVKLGNENFLEITDDSPIDSYECSYSLKVLNGFGDGIMSREVTLIYNAANQKIIVIPDTKILKKTSSFQRDASSISLTSGDIRLVEEGADLYSNKSLKIMNIPSIFYNAIYYKSRTDNENVLFNTHKETDVYIAVDNIQNIDKEYYYDKGFTLLSTNELLTADTGRKFYFYKRYLKNSGDSLFIGTQAKVSMNSDRFKFSVIRNDMLCKYNIDLANIDEPQKISLECVDDQNKILEELELFKDSDGNYSGILLDGALRYQNKKFQFRIRINENKVDSDIKWKWSFSDYLKRLKDLNCNIVFFKEVMTNQKYSFQFTKRQGNNYELFNDKISDNGTEYSLKGRGLYYGFNERIPVIQSANHWSLDYVTIPANTNINWQCQLPNGEYAIYLNLKVTKITENQTDKIIRINNKSYVLNNIETNQELFDYVKVGDNKLEIVNNGLIPLNLYSIKIEYKTGIMSEYILPMRVEKFSNFNVQEEKQPVISFDNTSSYRVDFDGDIFNSKDYYSLLLSAYSDVPQTLGVYYDKNCSEDSLLYEIKMNKNENIANLPLNNFFNVIHQDNRVVLYFKAGNGGTLLNYNNIIPSLRIIHEQEVDDSLLNYSSTGTLAYKDGNFIFTEAESSKKVIIYSNNILLSNFFQTDIRIYGLIAEDGSVNVIKIDVLPGKVEIFGIYYSNNKITHWDIETEKVFDGFEYRILRTSETEWKFTKEKFIEEEISVDGDYILEVRPILHEQKTPFLSYNFIIDRTGPSFSINSDIPNYTSNTKFDLSYFSKDHYTLTNDIKIVVISNGESREVKLIDGKISFLLNYGINDLTIFALDTLGNVSEKVERKIIVDNVAPHLSSELSYVKSKLNNTISAEIKYDCFDEFTDYDNLKVYYKVNDTDWILAANKKAILEYALYPEGELILQSYCEDLGGNKSVVISNKIIIDKTPLPKFGKVKLKKVGNDLQFSFDYGQYPDFKTFHVRKETFGNKEPGRSHLMSDFTEKEFVDSELLNDISFDYYFSVVDIYGNVSEEYVINSMNYVSTGVMTGVKLSLNIVNTTLSFTKDESIPEYIGGRFIELDNLWERDKVKYKFLDNSFYEFGPNNSMFNNYIIWEVPLSNYVISNTVDKKKLAVFYHNESLQKWEYVPTKYDAATNKLYAKIKHFSVFAIGEYTEGGTFLTENNVSNIDGSLNRTINLLELPTHQSSFKLNAVFNSNSVNQLSKFLMDENTSANNRIFYVYHLDTETSRDDRIINYENYAEVLKGRVEDKLKLTEWISKIDITEFPNCFSEPDYISASFVLDYKNCPQEVSSLYGAWDLNIPTLIAERNSSGKIIDNKSFKYVKLEDGVTYELYPDYDTGIHYNRVGKRFIYKKVDIKGQSFYVVKTEMYKNYVFNTKGQLRYIFTTNNLHADMENKLNGDKSKNLELEYIQSEVIEENGKNVKKNEIISYNKNSETQSKVILNYSIIGDKDIYFQELSSIEFQEKNVSDELGKIKTINFTYTDQITEPNINAYIYAHNHNITKSNDSIKIKFRSLKTIEETKSNNVNLRKINVDTQYKYVTMKEDTSKNRHFIEYSSALGIKGFPERKIIGNIKIYTNDSTIKTSDGKYYDKCVTNTSSKDSFPLTLQMDNFYSIQNDTKISTLLDLKGLPDDFIKNSNKIVQLSSFSISDSKDHTKTDYSFETLYPNDFKYLELLNERYLTVTKSTQNNNLEVHYEYTTTKDASNPFSKTKKTFNDKKYSFGSVSNGDEVSEEYTIGIQNVVIKKLESNSNKETFYDYDSAYRLHGVRVFYKDKLFNNSIYEYEYENSIISDRLVREVTYKSQNTWNEKIYKYKSLDNYCATDITLKKEEEFLYPQIDRVYEKIDGNTYKVHDNIYQKGVGNNRVNISKTKDYLGTKDTNDAISITSYGNDISYHYDPFNRVDKETHYNSSGVELYSVEYQYDTLNNIISTKKTGKSNTLKIDNTIINESRDVTTYKVYDLHNKEIAEYSNKEITLKFYDDYGRIIKKLTTDYKIDGEICSFVNTTYPVVYFFYDKYIEGDSYISMKMTRNENISLYLEYIKKIVKKNVDSTCYDFSEAQFTNYTTMLPATLDLLKKDGIYSELILQYRKDNIVVRESESKRDSKNSTHEKNVYYVKSYSGKEYFKIESLESGKYLFTARTYDIYNNISSNAIYTKGSLETASSPVSTDYYDGKIEYVYSYDTPYTIYRTTKKSNVQILFEALDNNNNVLLKKIYGDNGSVSKTDYTYNSLNKITKSVRDDGYEETFTYNIWGLESKDINNSPYASSGKIPQEKHLFDAYGNEISKFNTIMSMKQNKPNESYQYDSFGNLVLITYSKDTDIIYSGNTTTPNITDTLVYDTSNNLLLKRSNLHTDTPLLNDEKYEYNNRNLLKKKTSYGYDLSSSNTIEFTEEYSYNDNDQLIDKIISKKINTTPEVIDETYITEIDQNGKQCKIYSRKKGEKWNITTQSYSTDGKLKFSITKIVDSDSKLTRTNLNTLDILGELYKSEYYALYDDFNRLVAEVNSDGTRKYYKYNNKNQIEKMYENENFPSTIVDNKIIIGDLTSKRGMQFEYYPVSGSKYKEYTKNSSSVNIYYKEFQYDKYGRILSESMDRVYSGNSYKKINYKYDLLNRLSSINKDDVTETTTQFEYEGTDKTRKVTTSINKGDSKDTFSEIVYSDYGNVVSSKDRDGYIHIDKYDIAGNLVETVKKLGTVEVQRTSATYKKYLYMTTKSSGITNIAKKYYIDTYSYDTNGNISGIESKDLNGVILSSKSFTYYDNNLLKKQIINIGTGASVVTHTIQYEYKASGQLNKLIYPDGSQYTVDYTTTGELTATNPLLYKKDSSASVGNTIIKNISYITDTQKLNSIEYGDASLIAKVFEYDELGRLKSLDFNKNKTTSLLKQVYSYDTVGNISAIAETRKTDFIKKTYQRTFTYDSYNRLSSAYLTGGFSDMMNMKMHYIQYDHDDANNKVDFYDVQDDSNLKVDIKTKAPSILLKNRLAYNKSPAMIKIFKAPDTILAINMLKIMYFDKAGNKFLVDNDYTIEDKVSYVLITNTNLSNSNFEKIVKLTFMYDPTDKNDNSIENTANYQKISEFIKVYGDVNSITLNYDYDEMDNRVNQEKVTRMESGELVSNSSVLYSYDATKSKLSSDSNYKYEYNANGAMIKRTSTSGKNEWVYTWNRKNQLQSVVNTEKPSNIIISTINYTYDENGILLKKSSGTTTTTYIYNGVELLYEKTANTADTTKNIEKKYIYLSGSLISVIETANSDKEHEKVYYYYNVCGESTRFITNSFGENVYEGVTGPFGEEITQSAADMRGKWATHDGIEPETGLTYMINRWMDNETGRFISPDVMKQNLNYYTYANNNPYTRIDPDGNVDSLYSSWNSGFNYGFSSSKYTSSYSDGFDFSMSDGYNNNEGYDLNIISGNKFTFDFTESSMQKTNKIWSFGSNTDVFSNDTYTVDYEKHPIKSVIKDIGYNTVGAVKSFYNALSFGVLPPVKEALSFSLFTANKLSDAMNAFDDFLYDKFEMDTFDMTGALLPILPFSEGAWSGFRTMLSYGKKASAFGSFGLNGGKASIGSTGKYGENMLKQLGGESQQYFKTTGIPRGRFVDQLVDGIANESKVGYTSLTKSIQTQILKDVELISKGKIDGAVWHFYKSPITGQVGASQPLLNELSKYGIPYIIH